MRIPTVFVLVTLASLPVAAHPHKRPHRRAHAAHAAHLARVVQVVPDHRAAEEHARAEAELSDLRAGRIDEDKPASEAEPAQVWAVQENDAEIPANLRSGK